MEPPENAVSFNEIQLGSGLFQIRFPVMGVGVSSLTVSLLVGENDDELDFEGLLGIYWIHDGLSL